MLAHIEQMVLFIVSSRDIVYGNAVCDVDLILNSYMYLEDWTKFKVVLYTV